MSDGSLFTLTVVTTEMAAPIRNAQAMAMRLGARQQLNARIAINALKFTQLYLRNDTNHATADKLGAKPTNWRAKSARSIESDSDATTAILRIPRNTGLYRAFVDFNLSPKNGKKFLTIPASPKTYGKRVGDFPEGTFRFEIFDGRFPALVFVKQSKSVDADGNKQMTNEVGYWLRRTVLIKQDRTLLPSSESLLSVAELTADSYFQNILFPDSGNSGSDSAT